MDRDSIRRAVGGYRRVELPRTETCASVFLPVVTGESGAEVLFTKRPESLNSHGGEVSFPGGVVDEGESTLDGAHREVYEEIGVPASRIEVVGTLDDEISKAGFRVTPYVGLLSEPLNLVLSPDEVSAVYRIPLETLADPELRWTENWVRRGEKVTVYFFRHNHDIIWGLTARILYKFLVTLKMLDN
ncbi:NUDIX hydrolase [Limisalsivibrio acetivorans]|uniref:NUDIX hydrolase n=1 Tax=Limisalsivibrio acetivorans TaxID=1304888 RepID=UPI0003B65221|nr:CoA pyrophosphatase [Limisalsivibrio acetivorans]